MHASHFETGYVIINIQICYLCENWIYANYLFGEKFVSIDSSHALLLFLVGK